MVAMPAGGVRNFVSIVKAGAAEAGKAQPSATASAKKSARQQNSFFIRDAPWIMIHAAIPAVRKNSSSAM